MPAESGYLLVDELKTKFPLPKALALDRSGSLYVGCARGGVQKFVRTNRAEKFTAAWTAQRDKEGYAVLGLAVDQTGNIVASARTKQSQEIQTFSADGNFLTAWGSLGTRAGEFCNANGVALDRDGNLYVAETSRWGTGLSHRVQKFTSAGKFLMAWGTEGSGDGQFNLPVGIVLDRHGIVWVADTYNSRVQWFSRDGRFLGKWGGYGYEAGQLDCPQGIALDRVGNVYLADTYNNRVQRFTSDGKHLAHWGRQGSERGQFWLPCAVAVDDEGDVYVADTMNNRVQIFQPRAEGRERDGR